MSESSLAGSTNSVPTPKTSETFRWLKTAGIRLKEDKDGILFLLRLAL
jgi:hypothetical protein